MNNSILWLGSVRMLRRAVVVMAAFSITAAVYAQGGGGFGGSGTFNPPGGGFGTHSSSSTMVSERPDQILNFMTVEGSAETRLEPTQIRVVMAVTGEDETANGCKSLVEAASKRTMEEWKKIGIKESDIVRDFIAVLPKYE